MAVSAGSHRVFSFSHILVAAAATVGAVERADAVVVESLNLLLPPPAAGWVGAWNGSSAVPIAPNWVLTARHVGGVAGQAFVMRGVVYQSAQVVQHPTLDLQLVRVTTPLAGWHAIAPQQWAGTNVFLGGCGKTTLLPLPDNAGWDWSGAEFEAWGRNKIETHGSMLRVRFDAPSSQGAVPNEAAFALHDSGAGLFVIGTNGQLQLAGTAVTVSGAGASAYGSSSYCVSLHTAQSWIDGITGGSGTPPMDCNLFSYLSDWFAQDPAADYDGNQVINVPDLFAYLEAWFQGC